MNLTPTDLAAHARLGITPDLLARAQVRRVDDFDARERLTLKHPGDLPAHKYRRLHLNLPGLPEGSAYQPEPVMDAVERGVPVRAAQPSVAYRAFVDMSGGSSDDAVLGIGHADAAGRCVLDVLVDQGQRPPFDPNKAVERFVRTLKAYGISRVTGDRYAGETFRSQFADQGVAYVVSEKTKHELYEALEPTLNSRGVLLLDVSTLEQQLLGLVWRGGKIDHPSGEHDDYANACAGVVHILAQPQHDHSHDADILAMNVRRPSYWGHPFEGDAPGTVPVRDYPRDPYYDD